MKCFSVFKCFVLFALIFCLSSSAAISDTYQYSSSSIGQASIDEASSVQSDASSKINSLFNNLESAGSSLNGGGAASAASTLLDSGCIAAFERFSQTNLMGNLSANIQNTIPLSTASKSWFGQKSATYGSVAMQSFCAALRGEKVNSINFGDEAKNTLSNDLWPMLAMAGQEMARNSGIPLLGRVEIGVGTEQRNFISYISTVQPIWQDEQDQHHIFTQLSWYNANADHNDLGFQKSYSTLNAGLAYRYLTDDKNYLYGANIFFDHAPSKNHNRVSVGVDARTSQLAISANKYFPVSDWRKLDLYYEEKAAGGYDVEARGQIPQLPSWTLSFKGYEWDDQDKGSDLYGIVGAIEYSPVPAFAVRLAVRDESQSTPSLEGALRYSWRFDQPAEQQWKERTELMPVSDYIYDKVQRENIIRVKQQRRADSKLTVIQTIGANTSVESTGTTGLSVGQSLLMPVTVTVANSVGAIGRLRFADGSVLTLAQNSQAKIEPTLITLVSGNMQYVNNGAIQTVVVPGGTITLHGTDIDVVSLGGNSSVRVRDGAVDFVGSVSGFATLVAEEAAKSIAGVVGNISAGTADYISHTDEVSSEIDRIAAPQSGAKVTPYPTESPRIISSSMSVGGNIVIGLKFNSTVVVSGGTPRLAFTINGHQRYANYVGGSGTNDLQFSYTNVIADISALSLTVTGFDQNGSSIMGNGKVAVTSIADAILAISGTGDVTAPSGYTVAFTTTPINDSNYTAAAFTILSAEVGATYNYTITSSGGGTAVTGNGNISTATQSITGVNLSSLADGTLTISLTLTDGSANTGGAVTNTVLKNTSAPAGYSVAFTSAINNINKSAISLDISTAEIGSTYSYSITDGTTTIGPVTGTVTTASQTVGPIDVTSLTDGTITVSLSLTDDGGNVGVVATNTTTKDIIVPTILSVNPPANGLYEP